MNRQQADYHPGDASQANRPQFSGGGSGNIHDINASSGAGATSSPSEPEPEPSSSASHTQAQAPQVASSSSSSSSKEAGPAALPTPSQTPAPAQPSSILAQNQPASATGDKSNRQTQPLRFKFAPGMKSLLDPPIDSLPYGTDAWAFAQGWSTVVPLRAEFGGITSGGETWFERDGGGRIVPGDTF